MGNESPEQTCRLALCQVETHVWEFEANLERTRAALIQAAEGGAELAVTPECVLNGYPDHTPDNRGDWLRTAVELNGPVVKGFQQLLRGLKMDAVIGFAEKTTEGLLHNTAVHITAAGELAAVYRKIHCRNFESTCHMGHFKPGEHFVVSDLRLGGETFKLGLMICFDREITETVRCLRAMGAELIACPLATDTCDLLGPANSARRMDNEQITRARAAENEVAIVVVNHAARFNGGSFAVGPFGDTLGQMGAAAGVRIIEIPLARVRWEFQAQPLGWMGWGYRRPEVYKQHLA